MAKALFCSVFLSLIFLVGFYYVPVELVGPSVGHVTLGLCDFRPLPSKSVRGTTILQVQTDGGNVSLVIDKGRYSAKLIGGILKCENAEFLAVSTTEVDGVVIVRGDVMPVLTTTGESRKVLFVDSIRPPQSYEDLISSNRAVVGWIILMMMWLGSAFLFISVTKLMARSARGEVVEDRTRKPIARKIEEDER